MRAWPSLAAILAIAAAATAITAQQIQYTALWAEVAGVTATFTVRSDGVAVNSLGVTAAGTTQGTAVEVAVPAGTASPGVTAGRYAYTVRIEEASAAAATSGTWRCELRVDGVSKGVVYVTQATSDALNAEAVSLVWEVGTTLPSGAVAYDVSVTAV